MVLAAHETIFYIIFVPFKYFCAFERLLIFFDKNQKISVIPNFFDQKYDLSTPLGNVGISMKEMAG